MLNSIYYEVIKEYYGDQVANRTKIPYINHIHEGLFILDCLNSSDASKAAYCLHPIYQVKKTDIERSFISKYEPLFDDHVVFLAKEYAKTANSYLCKKHYNGINDNVPLSDHEEVNFMLRADKIQNRKDFEIGYESQSDKTVFDRSDKLSQYFKNWLKALDVSESSYQFYKTELIKREVTL